jgi:hypothetical protein
VGGARVHGRDDPDDKDLAAAAFQNIKQMQDAGSSGTVRIAVQIDLRLFPPVRFVIGDDGTLEDIQRRRETSTGQPKTLTSFLKWAERKFHAERYLLVLWGHGTGVGFELEDPASLGDVVFDADDGLEVRELADVLQGFKRRQGRPVDVLGFDACYMASIEVVYELRALADRLVGTQTSLPVAGWPYTRLLKSLKANPRQSTQRLVAAITQEVAASFQRPANITQTALAPGQAADGVRAAFQGLVKALRALPRKGSERRAVRRALTGTSFLEARQFVDLLDLCRRVHKAAHDPSIRGAAAEVIEALTRPPHLITSHRRKGRGTKRLNGVSIYLSSVRATKKGQENVDAKIDRYRRLSFVKTTGWQRFVDTLSRKRADTA